MSRKILLIEDNEDDIDLTRRALEESGLSPQLTVITDGREALDYLFQRGPYSSLGARSRPDLIILDLKLPLVNGFDLLEEIKTNEQTRVIPVVVLTISNAESDILRCYELGASSCIHKRCSVEAFNETIGNILTYWFNYAKLPPRV